MSNSGRGNLANIGIFVLAVAAMLWQSFAIHLIASWYSPHVPTTAQVFACFLGYGVLISGKKVESAPNADDLFSASVVVAVFIGIAWAFRFVMGVG